MKLKLIASLVAASFLAGCSSSGSSDSTPPSQQDGIASVQYFEGENIQAALITGDEGTYQTTIIKGQETDTLIRINGQTFTTDGDSVKDSNGVIVGHIQKEGDSIIFHGNHGAEVNLSVVNGRLIVTDVQHPIDPNYGVIPTPEYPIELDPEADNGRSVEKVADNAWVVTTHGEIDGYITIENGTVYLRDSDRNEITNWKPIDPGFGTRPTPEKPIEIEIEADNGRSVDKVADNAWAITTHDEVDGYITIESGTIYLRDSDRNEIKSWKPELPRDLNDIKTKAKSLSQEQRQQIKQAIKDRAIRS